MKLHPRTLKVQTAMYALETLVWEWVQAHDVTYLEALQALSHVSAQVVKYAIRVERHPDDPDKKGDEE